MTTPHSILRQYWGYDRFRPLQEEIISSVLEGKDTLALLPTGGGKSICFQVPALMKDGICVVITPLISLMKDQVENLKQRGIPALAVHSGLPWREVEKNLKNALYGNFKFLYLSPERLQTSLFKEYAEALKVNLITVDEAHCISQWGYDFRPAYLKIAGLRELMPSVTMLALTATATVAVRKDIQEKLLFPREHILLKSFARENLSYSVFHEEGKINKVMDILQKVPGSSIVFCRNRRHTQELARLLLAQGISAQFYHAGLTTEERTLRQDSWMNNEIRAIVCTNAFGMGIDKPDVRTVIHYDAPDSLEAYYQEAGRAGRDGKKAYAVLLYQQHELQELEERIELQYPSLKEIKKVFRAIVNYLQVPAGSGEGVYYDFEINDFARTFHINATVAWHAIKILEQEEILLLSDTVFLPSRISFTTNKIILYQFEKDFPDLEPLIKCLLRTYEGIFDNFVPVSEKLISRILKVGESALVSSLLTLQGYGILQYEARKDKPQLSFLQRRVSVGDLQVDMRRVNERKKHYAARVRAMTGYIANRTDCRGTRLLQYLDEQDGAACGICDVCLQARKGEMDIAGFRQLSEKIFGLLQEQPLTMEKLLKQLDPLQEEQVQETLRFLLDEEKIKLTERGELAIGH